MTTLQEYNELTPIQKDWFNQHVLGLKYPVFLARIERSVVFEYNYAKDATVEDVRSYAESRQNP